MMSLLELFVSVDDFCQVFLPFWERKLLQEGSRKRRLSGQLSVSEMMTIIIYFHQSHYRNFKAYYTQYVCQHLRGEFPKLVSYGRFVIRMPSVLGPLSAYLKSLYGHCHGLSFIDSTALLVCDNHRIHNHKVFAHFAQRGKGSMGWFYGFKLHLVINKRGELLACQITPGNIDDRKPVPALCKHLFGKLIADRGYVSQPLFEQFLDNFGVQLITKLRKNMKNRLLPWMDKLLLRKRAIIESVVDQLKNISNRKPNYACGTELEDVQWRLDADGLHLSLKAITDSEYLGNKAWYEAKPWQKIVNPQSSKGKKIKHCR